jgi:hypothetical protein
VLTWLENQSPDVCRSCYWANPESYKHIALRPIRRLDVVWEQQEVEIFEKLKQRAEVAHESTPDYVKKIIEKHLQDG